MKKAQFAMEYLMIVGFSLLLLVPMFVFVHSEYTASKDELSVSQLVTIANQLTDTAELLYYQGPGSKTTLRIYFPPQIQSMTITSHQSSIDNELYYFIEFIHENSPITIQADSAVPIEGNIIPFSGVHMISLTVDDNGYPLDTREHKVVIKEE